MHTDGPLSLLIRRRRWRRRLPAIVLATCVAMLAQAALAPAAPMSATTSGTPAASPASASVIAAGVFIGGVEVGGMTRTQAADAVNGAWLRTPINVKLERKRFLRTPAALGLTIELESALDAALAVVPSTTPTATRIPLPIAVDPAKVRQWVDALERATFRPAINASYRLRRGRPVVSADRPGARVDRGKLTRLVYLAIQQQGPARSAAQSRTQGIVSKVPAAVTVRQLKPVVVIDRSATTLVLWSPLRRVKRYRVAVGQPKYPTPLGKYSVLEKQVNPWWRPPDSDWAEDAEPIPPGPNNPLGTRWIGLGGGIGIHGTNNPGSIGTAASHGCIRMRTSDVEDLYRRLPMGSPVHVVR